MAIKISGNTVIDDTRGLTNITSLDATTVATIENSISAGITYIRVTSNYTASTNEGVIADTSGGSFTVSLPSSPSLGDTVIVTDGADWSVNNLTINRNSSTIEGAAEDLTMDIGGVSVQFTYDGTTWQVYAQGGAANNDLFAPIASPTFTGDVVIPELSLTGNVTETIFNITGTTPAIDPANGTIQTWTLSGTSTPSFASGGWADGESLTILIDDGTGFDITWPTMQWVGGSAPTLATTGYSGIVILKVGGVYYGSTIGDFE